jgi:hypothetical protein
VKAEKEQVVKCIKDVTKKLEWTVESVACVYGYIYFNAG